MRLFLVLALFVTLPSCNALQNAAARDPQRCERDPTCAKKRGHSNDCNTQCADSPACVQRCEEIEISSGTSGR
jgi:hypothetical protein